MDKEKTSQYFSPFQLIGTSIRELKIDNSFTNLVLDDATETGIQIKPAIKSIERRSSDILRGIMLLDLDLCIQRKEGEFNLHLSLEGCFEGTSFTEDQFHEMLLINGASTLYSIGRSIILTTCSLSAGGAQILLPMVNFVDLYKSTE